MSTWGGSWFSGWWGAWFGPTVTADQGTGPTSFRAVAVASGGWTHVAPVAGGAWSRTVPC